MDRRAFLRSIAAVPLAVSALPSVPAHRISRIVYQHTADPYEAYAGIITFEDVSRFFNIPAHLILDETPNDMSLMADALSRSLAK